MSAASGAFFGAPIGAALFALKIPHRRGLQYFEAIASFVSFVLTSQITMIKTQRCRDLHEVNPSNLILEQVILPEEKKTTIPGLKRLKQLVRI